MNTSSYESTLLTGHDAPVLSVALDRSTTEDGQPEFVASSSCDGSVRIWRWKTQELVADVKEAFASSNDVSNSVTRAQLAFHPKGKFVAFAGEKGWKKAKLSEI